tara:strand:+ start:3544 stop:5838 length:2295 start_codon:yes stop_codon:yes gene_type:complete
LKKPERKVIFFLRAAALTLLIIALSTPYILESKSVKGNPRLTILVDNSSSMNLYDPSAGLDLFNKLEGAIKVNIRTIAAGDESAIGSGILNHMEGGDNLLVVTDGNNNKGKLLGDIMLLAQSINATISTLDSKPVNTDVGVTIAGHHELIKDSEGEFKVNVNVVGDNMPYTLQVLIDDKVVVQHEDTKSKEFILNKKFSEGKYHKIVARLENVGENDYYRNNNIYYKSVKVVPRPSVLFVSNKQSPLANNLFDIYDVDFRNSIPNDLSEYMSVILNDIPASQILPKFDKLNDFVINGDGLVFIGGENSYESGNYKGTIIETLLPVNIGAGEEENKSDSNIAIVLDISSGTADYIAVEKALAISVIESLDEKNNVGVVAFGFHPCSAFKVADIQPLKEHKKELIEKISRLKFDGQSCFDIGIQGGFDLLSDVGGGKSIIFISDGKAAGSTKLKERTISDVRQVNARGVKVYTVGVGTDTDEKSADNILFLSNMAVIGRGIFFKADSQNRLKILFGKPGETKEEKEFFNSLVTLDSTHFITDELRMGSTTIGGYNYVVPKPNARLLITTNKKIPFLTVWRFGLGRVVSFTSDDGTQWAGELLNDKNSRLVTRSINWAIGDLSRKQAFDVTIKDVAIGDRGYINVISKDQPKSEGLSFAKIDTNFYSADFISEGTGFKDLMEATYAVNYKDEFTNLGINNEFTGLVEKTGGRVFDPADVEGILEYVKSKSKRIKINSIEYRWPFIGGALVLFLLDVAYRRKNENKKW